MAKTAAQRQAEYRKRRDDGDGEYRVNSWISSKAFFALSRLAKRYGVTKREMVERLATEADDRVSAGFKLDSPEWNEYFGVTA
jgi:hypothetical protein